MNEIKKILLAMFFFAIVQAVAAVIAVQMDINQLSASIFAAGVVGMKAILDAKEAKAGQ